MTPSATMIDLAPTKRVSQRRLFSNVGYQPHSIQREFHKAASQARFRLVDAGRRTGKSNMGGHELTQMAFKALYQKERLSPTGRRHEYWIVGPEFSDGEKEFRVMYDDMQRLELPFDKPGTYYSVAGGNMDVSLWGGRFQVHVKSAKQPDNLVGEALEGVILAEAAKLKPLIWTKYIRPMLADYRGWASFTSTPEGKNWFYDMYMRGQDPADEEVWSVKAPSWSNDILFPLGRLDPEIISMGRDMSEEKFKQEIGAEFTDFTGRVFKRFSEEDNVGDFRYNPSWPLYVATDYGFTNPNVMLFIQTDPNDTVYVIAEYYQRGRTAEEFARDIDTDPRLGALVERAQLLFPDPEDPSSSKTLSEKLKLQIMGGTGGLIKDRLDLIRRWLKPQPEELEDGDPLKQPKLFVDRSCTHTIREMNDYRYPDSKTEEQNATSKENPLKEDDHSPEALGRFFGGHFGQQFKPKRRARQSTARMSSLR